MKNLTPFLLLISMHQMMAQNNPVITSWWINSDSTVVQGVVAGVKRVDYTNTQVYITTSGVPEYYEDGHSVNSAAGQNWVFRLPLSPQEKTVPKSDVPFGGPIGVLVDGSAVFGPLDAMTWNNGGVWHRIAYYFEVDDFDTTNGHSAPPMAHNTYHHHVNPVVVYTLNPSAHSPIIGFAFDGYPIYGPFGYANDDGTGGIKMMTPGYQLRNISDRQLLPDSSVNPGPAIGGQYPLGCFQEDYEYVAGSGDLDEHNGRECVTPEYPEGTYAYFATVDNLLQPVYPYFLGLTYFGVVDPSNSGPTGGQNTVPSNATQYIEDTTTAIKPLDSRLSFSLMPNPADDYLLVRKKSADRFQFQIYNVQGQIVKENILSKETEILDISTLPPGIYVVVAQGNPSTRITEKFIKQ